MGKLFLNSGHTVKRFSGTEQTYCLIHTSMLYKEGSIVDKYLPL